MDPKKQVAFLSRGAAELLTPSELEAKLHKGKPLRVKAGFDPTIADLHLGHTVVMQKLKQFEELGHQVIFLIGDATARVGDPSGQSKTRPTLSAKEIEQNAKTYLDQAFKILDKKKTEVRRNSEWFKKMNAMEIVDLAGHYNVARMLEREDFKKRYTEGGQVTIQEFIYPLMQGYDSVVLKADVELGGSDQKFNLAVARDIQRAHAQDPEVILTMPLLVGTDGVKKMSKSYGNYIGITEPPKEIFGKLMALSDEMMWHYYELLTDEDLSAAKKMHPKEAKIALAKAIVTRYHSAKEAEAAAEEFEKVFGQKGKPGEIEEKVLSRKAPLGSLVQVIVQTGLVPSKSEARRLIEQGGVTVDDQKIQDIHAQITTTSDHLIKVGKRRFLRVRFE
ncbi:MAG: tyrosine--tRNA ligase [Deltaproteobacteria bacterium]|nr:tyrosine--tRNA ligase [Deltaproteobacteria bacterium]MDZ4224921.1 tyrosine--tRNA ligase [bacterium]